jgi:hypothetical protein
MSAKQILEIKPMPNPDLTQRPPRSPRVLLGGYVILPRMLDKGRATVDGKNGDFHYNCPLDQQFLSFVGIDANLLKEQLAMGKGDVEILEWINAHAKCVHPPSQIAAWSDYQEKRSPGDLETRQFFHESHSKLAPNRRDITTWFDLLDLDDYITFGGTP